MRRPARSKRISGLATFTGIGVATAVSSLALTYAAAIPPQTLGPSALSADSRAAQPSTQQHEEEPPEEKTRPTGRWIEQPPLAEARGRHTATLLRNGNVLVAGGDNPGGSSLQSAVVYDSKARSWRPTGSMIVGRSGAGAVRLRDGRVLMVGGWDGQQLLRSSELYDPSTGTWTLTRGGMRQERSGMAAVLLHDGRVLVAGGWPAPDTPYALMDAEIYSPRLGRWIEAEPMTVGRVLTGGTGTHAQALLLRTGRVLVVGGTATDCCSYITQDSAEVFSPFRGMWRYTGAPSVARGQAVLTELTDGNVLVAGGTSFGIDNDTATAEVYDLKRGRWSFTGSMKAARADFTGVTLRRGHVLVVGGLTDSGVLASAELYSPRKRSWTSVPPLPIGLTGVTATSLPSGTALIAGGLDESLLPTSRAWLFVP